MSKDSPHPEGSLYRDPSIRAKIVKDMSDGVRRFDRTTFDGQGSVTWSWYRDKERHLVISFSDRTQSTPTGPSVEWGSLRLTKRLVKDSRSEKCRSSGFHPRVWNDSPSR